MRGRTDDPFALLAKAVGDHSVDARSIVTEDGDYGQVLLSRWPFAEPPKISDVSYQEREPRRAIAARILSDHGEVRVIATHLGLSIHERHAQAHALIDLVRADANAGAGRFQRLVLGEVGEGCAGADLPGPNPVADVSRPIADDAAGSDLCLARSDDPRGLDRSQGQRVFGPSSRDRGYRVSGIEHLASVGLVHAAREPVDYRPQRSTTGSSWRAISMSPARAAGWTFCSG